MLDLYRALITLRLDYQALAASDDLIGCAFALDDDTIALRRSGGGEVFWIVVRFRSAGTVRLDQAEDVGTRRSGWDIALTTEDPLFSPDPLPPLVDADDAIPVIHFRRAGGVILRRR